MSTKSWTLTDVGEGGYVDQISLGASQLGRSARGCSVKKRTLRGGLSDGVDIIEVDNGTFSFSVLPTRGMGIWKGRLGDLPVGWQSPITGPVHPKFVPQAEPSGLGFLDGFDELIVRCGLESNGAPEFDELGRVTYPLHGRIANKPARRVDVVVDSDTGEIAITGVVEETRFHFTKLRLTATVKTKPGESGFRLHDTIENLSGTPAEAQMLYHVNFGPPLLDAGAQFVAPLKTVVPCNDHAAAGIDTWNSYAAEQAGYEEQVYFLELVADREGQTRTLLKNAHSTMGVSMYFATSQLPCFTIWKNTVAMQDGYVTGLEPGINFPNPRTFEGRQGRVAKLAAGQSISLELGMEVHDNIASVEKAENAIAVLQGNVSPQIHNTPQDGWCAP